MGEWVRVMGMGLTDFTVHSRVTFTADTLVGNIAVTTDLSCGENSVLIEMVS